MNNKEKMSASATDIIAEAQSRAIYISHAYGILISRFDEEYTYYPPTSLPTFDSNNGVVSWVNELGQFVLPYESDLLSALGKAGYEKGLFVPFSNGDVPSEFRETWALLKAKRELDNRQEELHNLETLSTQKGVKPLPDSYLSRNCLQITGHGMEVVHFGKTSTVSAEIVLSYDPVSTHKLGTFCQNNGVICFIDHHGRTFCTVGSQENRDFLCEYGYTEGSFFVPLSNGERPTVSWANSKWEHIIRSSK